MLRLLKIIPSLILVFLIYNLMVLDFKDHNNINFETENYINGLTEFFNEGIGFKVNLPSQMAFQITRGDSLLILGLLLLFFEICKSTSASNLSIAEHVFSILLFILFIFEFLSYGYAGTSLFMKLALLSFIDAIAGIVITITAARRDVSIRR